MLMVTFSEKFHNKNILKNRNLPNVGFTLSKKEIRSIVYIKNHSFPFLHLNILTFVFYILHQKPVGEQGPSHSNSRTMFF